MSKSKIVSKYATIAYHARKWTDEKGGNYTENFYSLCKCVDDVQIAEDKATETAKNNNIK